jgi:tRNA(Ile)-lysidine synthase
VCLLHILLGLSGTLGVTLHVAHLNHLLRGAESDADAECVCGLARDLAIPASVERRDVRAYQQEHRLSLEEAAREVRYAFFAEVARSIDASAVAVGHTADDQTETILMHLVRGTGLAGLRGMKPMSTLVLPGGNTLAVVRPLLDVRREETEAYCAAHGLAPRTDSSNLWPDHLRNRLRAELVPRLREYNPSFEEALHRTARAAEADLSYIDQKAAELWGSVAREQPTGIAIDKAEFSRLHPAMKWHLLRSATQRLLGDLRDIEYVHVESLLDALSKPAGKRLSLPRGLTFWGDYTHGFLALGELDECPFPPLEAEHGLTVPGETMVGGWKVTCTVLDRQPAKRGEDRWTAYLDLHTSGLELAVRGRRRGERFQPLGMEVPKKLQDFFVDAKVPGSWRDRVPLVCSPQGILWAVGYRIGHPARVTPSTKRVLCVEFEKA